tara:strand:+ start:1963 stop:3045 length:1083 start_codon:yes stop_codon:yes gene_type:complete
MNILTDVLSLIRRGIFAEKAGPDDVLVLGVNEEPVMTGIASPIPYKSIKVIKVKDLKIAADQCDHVNVPIKAASNSAGVYQKTEIDSETERCTVSFRKIRSLSTNLTVAESADNDYVELSTSGEPNTAANVGGGAGIWKDKVGETLNFKSLVQGSNITIAESTNEITISAASGGSTRFNVGADTGTQITILENESILIKGDTGISTSIANNGAGADLSIDLDDTSVIAGSYTNTNITVDAQGRLTAATNGSAPYTSYVQLLTQGGEDPPAGPILENTAGITITWTYSSDGIFKATYSTPLADINKTSVRCSNTTKTSSGGVLVGVTASFTTEFHVVCKDTNGIGLNSQLLGATLEIRIYP